MSAPHTHTCALASTCIRRRRRRRRRRRWWSRTRRVTRDAERVGGKPRKIPKEGRKSGGKKLYVQLPILRTRGKVGFLWPAGSPFAASVGGRFFMRNELISFLRLKKLDRDVAPHSRPRCSKKRRIKSREINANTFYVLRQHASWHGRLARFLSKSSRGELFCRKSGVVHLFECTFRACDGGGTRGARFLFRLSNIASRSSPDRRDRAMFR